MTGLDTNVLVRYITQDDRKQAASATVAIESATTSGETLLILPVVLCELVWVLETSYGLPKQEVAAILDQVLRTAQFEFVAKDTVVRALADYRSGRGDFAGHYIGRANSEAGAPKTLTFDKGLGRSSRFELLTA